MVDEWNKASRGRKLPEKVEKKADLMAWHRAKMAFQGMMLAAEKMGPMTPKPSLTTARPNMQRAQSAAFNAPHSLDARAGMSGIVPGSSASASQATSAKLQAGESLTMPT
jgi:hypothetical protein